MPRTLLQLLQATTAELGLQQPLTVIGSTDPQIMQILALANREGKTFSAMANGAGGWQAMRKEHTFPLVDAQTAYDLPADLQFFLIETEWDRNNHWQLLGPLSAQEWQVLKSGITVVGPRKRFRVMQGQFYLDPTPAAGEAGNVMAFEYISNGWCESAAGAARTIWTADTDVYVLDEECFILGVKWRFLRAKGLDYSEEKREYDDACERAQARDGAGARSLPLNACATELRLISTANIPDTGYGT